MKSTEVCILNSQVTFECFRPRQSPPLVCFRQEYVIAPKYDEVDCDEESPEEDFYEDKHLVINGSKIQIEKAKRIIEEFKMVEHYIYDSISSEKKQEQQGLNTKNIIKQVCKQKFNVDCDFFEAKNIDSLV